jgi:putative DNA primase/helicase
MYSEYQNQEKLSNSSYLLLGDFDAAGPILIMPDTLSAYCTLAKHPNTPIILSRDCFNRLPDLTGKRAIFVTKSMDEFNQAVDLATPGSQVYPPDLCIIPRLFNEGIDIPAELLNRAITVEQARQLRAHTMQETPPSQPEAEPMPEHAEAYQSWQANAPFRCLGYDHGSHSYLPNGSRQVLTLNAPEHSKNHLLNLAPLQWWERNFPGPRGVDWTAATNALIRASEATGIYDPTKIRGRGAWEDAGRSVLHCGDLLIVNGKPMDITDIEAAHSLNHGVGHDPLKPVEAVKLLDLCRMLAWEAPISAVLLSGWCVVAVICGALRWRPHIWVTGPAGSGKTWVLSNVLRPALGPAALLVQSSTTEAGIRQKLVHDARPVLFDEAEGEDKAAAKRVQSVIELVRQASSETGGEIVKGTTGGKAQSFTIRSCFAFSSIGVGLEQHADCSRISVLALTRRRIDFTATTSLWRETLCRPEWCSALRARSVQLLPVIQHNAETFSQAAAERLGSQRSGDQVGALLAGAYSLHRSDRVDLPTAREWVSRQEWGEDHTASEDTRDEVRCLHIILAALIRYPGGKEDAVGNLLDVALHGALGDSSTTEAEAALNRHGIKTAPDRDAFYISDSHPEIRKIMAETAWSKGWGKQLARIDGAERKPGARFAGGVIQRCTSLPANMVI